MPRRAVQTGCGAGGFASVFIRISRLISASCSTVGACDDDTNGPVLGSYEGCGICTCIKHLKKPVPCSFLRWGCWGFIEVKEHLFQGSLAFNLKEYGMLAREFILLFRMHIMNKKWMFFFWNWKGEKRKANQRYWNSLKDPLPLHLSERTRVLLSGLYYSKHMGKMYVLFRLLVGMKKALIISDFCFFAQAFSPQNPIKPDSWIRLGCLTNSFPVNTAVAFSKQVFSLSLSKFMGKKPYNICFFPHWMIMHMLFLFFLLHRCQ